MSDITADIVLKASYEPLSLEARGPLPHASDREALAAAAAARRRHDSLMDCTRYTENRYSTAAGAPTDGPGVVVGDVSVTVIWTFMNCDLGFATVENGGGGRAV